MNLPLRIGILSVLLLSPASAQQLGISWGTSLVMDTIIEHDGSELVPSDYTVALGAFTPGFNPAVEPLLTWEANWQTFDAITTPDGHASDFFLDGAGSTGRFAGSANLDTLQHSDSEDADPLDVFGPNLAEPAGQPAYVWVYNTLSVGAGTEWALYTNAGGNGPVGADPWLFPTVTGFQFGLSWFISSADTAVIGAIHDGSSPAYVGTGYVTDTSNDFLIRTHRLIAAPEPGTVALILLGTLSLLRRQRF